MERLQKVLASAGIASRRKAEELIKASKVKVNGQVVKELGTKVDPEKDEIYFAGKKIKLAPEVVYAFYKPSGVTSTVSDAHADKKIVDFFPKETRLYPIGRLDKDSEGLILLTNDGELAQELTHPKFGHEKEYEVLLSSGRREQVEKLGHAHKLDGEKLQPMRLVSAKQTKDRGWAVRLVLKEGKKRQIRRIAKMCRFEVLGLKRVRIGKLRLGSLQPGKWRIVTRKDII